MAVSCRLCFVLKGFFAVFLCESLFCLRFFCCLICLRCKFASVLLGVMISGLNIFLLVLFCTGASFVQRVSGFGFGIFIMTALPFIMPSYGEATTLSGLLSAAQSLYVLVSFCRFVAWRRLLFILLAFVVTSFFAVEYVAAVSDSCLKRLLGVALVLLSLYFLMMDGKVSLRPSVKVQFSAGALSGVLGGLFGMQGPPAVLYFMASEKDKNSYMAMTQLYFLVGNLVMTVFRARNGFLTAAVGEAWLFAIAGVVVGSFFGKRVFDRVSADKLRKIVYFYMLVSGMVAVFS